MRNLILAVQAAVVFGIVVFTSTTPARAQAGAWSDVGGGVSDIVTSLAVHDDGTGEALYVGGMFTFAGDTRVNHIAKWNGRSWSAVGSGIPGAGGFGGPWVRDLVEFDDGSGGGPRLYACGNFASAVVGNVTMWDGQTWSGVGGGISGGGSGAYTMEVFDDGTGPALYVGGTFTSAGGQPASRIAKWDGRTWSDVGGGVHPGSVLDLLMWDDGTGPGLVVAGQFTSAGAGDGAIAARGIARWRNGAWSTFGEGGLLNASNYARCLAAWPPRVGSSLIVGGWFGTPPKGGSFGLALWNGATWQHIAPEQEPDIGNSNWGAHGLHSVRVGDCDQLFILGGYTETWLQRWNGDAWKPMAAGIGSLIWGWWPPGTFNAFIDFAIFQDRVYVGGGFTTVGGMTVNNIGVWNPYLVLDCAADANQDGDINVDDLVAVILQWGACDDCTGDNVPCGGDGDVNVDDLVSVITGWGPCPSP